MLAGPHPRQLSRGDFAPRSGPQALPNHHGANFHLQPGTTAGDGVS